MEKPQVTIIPAAIPQEEVEIITEPANKQKCAFAGCKTILNRYSPHPFCNVHNRQAVLLDIHSNLCECGRAKADTSKMCDTCKLVLAERRPARYQ